MDQAQEQSQPSIRERIGAVMASQEQPQEPVQQEEPQEAPQQEVEAPQAAEISEETAIAVTPEIDWKEVELDGETLHVPPKWEKAFLQERDYTQKTQALAEQRKVLEIRAQQQEAREQALQHLQPLYLQAHAVEAELQRFQRIDWNALYQQDVMEHNAKKADYALLLQQRGELTRQIEHGHGYLNQQRQAAMAQAAHAAMPIIKKAIPDWGAEKDTQLTRFALDNGASPEELMGLATRPWAVILLEKARKFDELQATKAQLPKKAQALSPVAKPGAKPTLQSSEGALHRKNVEQFRKSGGKDKGVLKALISAKLKNLGAS